MGSRKRDHQTLPGHTNEIKYVTAIKPTPEKLPGEEFLGIDPLDPEELWVRLPGYEDTYAISNKARIRRIGRSKGTVPGRILKPKRQRINPARLSVDLSRNNKVTRFILARLVAMAFLPRPRDKAKQYVLHLDGDMANNRPENLRWVTYETAWMAGCAGDAMSGNQKGGTPLTLDEKQKINELASKGMTQMEIARQIGRDHQTVTAYRPDTNKQADGINYLTVRDAAKAIGITHNALLQRIMHNTVPGAIKPGYKWQIPVEWIEIQRKKK